MANPNAIPLAPESVQTNSTKRVMQLVAVGLVGFVLLAVAAQMFMAGDALFGVVITVLAGMTVWVFGSSKMYVARYVYPGLTAIFFFIVFPFLYTFNVSFTNYSSANLLTFERAKDVLLKQTYMADGGQWRYELHQNGELFNIVLINPDDKSLFVTPDIALDNVEDDDVRSYEMLPTTREALTTTKGKTALVVQNRKALQNTIVRTANGTELSYSGLTKFAALQPLYKFVEGGDDEDVLIDLSNQTTYKPNNDLGLFQQFNPQTGEFVEGETIRPGFISNIGWANYERIFNDEGMFKPFFKIFGWTITFAVLTVFITYSMGLVLAALVEWEPIKLGRFYQMFMILPYAVPAFISIQIWRGLFNPAQGEINLILQGWFGIAPAWTTNPNLAKVAVMITNTWLGYPYMMILALGMIQSVSKDYYEAAKMDGSGVLHTFFRITVPLITKPLIPLLIASFAFNFNNFLVIELLMANPNIIGANPLAGETDLLVNYAYRLAFKDGSQEFALAAAISTLIFILVGFIAMFQIRFAKIEAE